MYRNILITILVYLSYIFLFIIISVIIFISLHELNIYALINEYSSYIFTEGNRHKDNDYYHEFNKMMKTINRNVFYIHDGYILNTPTQTYHGSIKLVFDIKNNKVTVIPVNWPEGSVYVLSLDGDDERLYPIFVNIKKLYDKSFDE